MATSQNGFPANNRSLVHNPTVPGTNITFPGGIRKGAVTTVLLYVAVQWHRRIEPLTADWNWGYGERTIRGSSTTLSNHASGTATDHNAPKHPLAKRGTFSAAQRAELQKIAREVDNVVRFGEFYSGRVDGMHAEINAPLSAVERVAARLLTGQAAPVTPAPTSSGSTLLRRGSKGDAVKAVQQRLKVAYRSYGGHLAVDGDFGPATEAVVKEFQRRAGLAVDGVVGPATLRALGL